MAVEKDVKIKLSAESSKLEKSLNKLEKFLNDFSKNAEKLNSTKTDKLENNLQDINKVSKKLVDGFSNTKKQIETLNKAKLDKLQSNMNNSLKASEKVKGEVEKLKKALDEVNKAKTTSLTSQLKELDLSTSNNTKEFTKLKSVIDSLSSSSTKISSLNGDLSDLKETITAISDTTIANISIELDDIASSSIASDEYANSLYETLNRIQDITLGDIAVQINNIGSSALDSASSVDSLYSSLSSVSGVNANSSVSISADTSGAVIDTSSIEKFSELGVVANTNYSKLGQTLGALSFANIGKGTASVNQLNNSNKSMLGSTIKSVAQFAIFSAGINKVTNAINSNKQVTQTQTRAEEQLQKATQGISKAKEQFISSVKKSTQATNQEKSEVDQVTEKIKRYEQEITKTQKTIQRYSSEIRKSNGTNKEAEAGLEREVAKLKALQQGLTQAKNKLNGLTNASNEFAMALDESSDETTSFSDRLQSLGNSNTVTWLNSIKDGFSDLFKAIKSGDIGGITSSLAKLWGTFKLMPAWAKIVAGIGIVVTALKKLYDMGKQRFFAGLQDIESTLSPIVNTFEKIGSSARTAFESITDTNLSLSSLMSIGINFENQMQKVATISGAVGTGLSDLTELAKLLGGTTKYTSTEVSEAFEFMASAGYSVNDMLNSMGSVLNLATISGTGLAECSDIVTQNLTALGMSSLQATDFVDKLVAVINAASTDVPQFGKAMENVGALAGALGINMTDLSTAIGLASNAGVRGEKIGTALKNVLANMSAPTKQQGEALQKLGLTADKTGSYLKTTASGNVDLAETMKSLMKATEGMDKTEKASILTKIAGKEAIAGLLAVLNQSEEAWDEMSDTIDNSTSSVQFFNENMSLVGKKGKEATKYIEQLKEIFGECEERATELGLSSNDLALSLSLLGNDGTVTAKSMNDLLDVFESMNVSVGKNEKLWRTIGNAEKNNINTGYDYNATLLTIDSSITGLSQSQKEKIKSQLKENMTYEKANKILKEYGLNAERIDLSTLSTSEKIDYLRDSLKGCTEEEIKATLAKLGLSESFNEVNEILKMSDKDYKQYLKNMQTVEGMSEKLAKAMDVTTKGSLLNLASAIENVAISAFEELKPAIKNTSDALYDFFDVWHNGDKNTFTLEGLEKAFTGLEEKVRSAMPNISKAIVDGIGGINNFINGGSLDSLLKIGTDIVTSICNGIITAYDNGTLTEAISGFITKISDWIIENGPKIQKAGGDILDAINTGISQNSSKISQAFDIMYGIINTWVSKKQKAIGQLGATIAWAVIKGMIVGIGQGIGNWFSTIGAFLENTLTGMVRAVPKFAKIGWDIVMGIAKGISDARTNIKNTILLFIDHMIKSFCDLLGIHSPSTVFSGYGLNIIEGLANGLLDNIGSVTKAIGDIANAVIDGFKDIWDKIFGKKDKDAELLNIDTTKIKEAQKALNSLSSTVTTVTSTIRSSFTSITNIIRNQCVGMANIVRNQFTSISNIISNQCQNARNLATSSFISLYKVISTQVGQARDTVSTKFISIASVVNTQSWKARDNGTSAFISLAKVIKTQMMNAYSSVSTYMNKIASATNVTLSAKVNVSKTITTTEVTVPSTNSLYSVNDLATTSNLVSTLDLSQSTLSSSNNSIGQAFSGIKQNNNQTIEVPVYLDGRQIAKASAKYINGELKAISDRETRKSGRK